MRRLFVAINLNDENKAVLAQIQDYYSELPLRWIKKQNFHITLLFLGYIKEEIISEIEEILSEISKNIHSFELTIKNTSFEPNNFKPRMIWAKIQDSENLKILQKEINNKLIGFCQKANNPNIKRFSNFNPHITMAKALPQEIIDARSVPKSKEINLKIKVESIELMESFLQSNGAEYKIVKSFNLSEKNA